MTMNNKQRFIWAGLFHMGTNMWNDSIPEEGWEPYVDEYKHLIAAADHLRFDEKVWRSLTSRMATVGMNMVVIDLGEAIRYPSHPELWVEGSWEIERFRAELARLRAMGLEPIPKLNFSATHDIWLKEYAHMLSTPEYWACDTNFASTVKYCRSVCSPEHLKGFLMTTWHFTLPQWEKKNLEAIDQVGAVVADSAAIRN